MRRYIPLLASFGLGVLSTVLFFGVHTSTVVQSSFAQTTAPPSTPPTPPASASAPSSPYTDLLAALSRRFGPSVFVSERSMPVVPNVWMHMSDIGIKGMAGIQQLDGMDCDGCDMSVSLLTYAGGQFRCRNCKIQSANGVFLLGPAQNTLQVLQIVGAIPGPKPEAPNPNGQKLNTIQMSNSQGRLDWVSLQK